MSETVEPKKGDQDIQVPELASLDWTTEQAPESLLTVYHYVTEAASQAIRWYQAARRPKRRWARRLRVGAILAVAVAGVLPVLSQIFDGGGSVVIQPAWATVALAIAVALIALDRFFGFSSAWARYIATDQAISAALNQFMLDWQQSMCGLAMEGLTQEHIDHLLDLAKKFLGKTDDLVQAETSQWTSEFRETLTEIERSAQTQGK